MNVCNLLNITISRKIFTDTASLIFYEEKPKTMHSVTISSWLKLALGNDTLFRKNDLTFDQYMIFIDLCTLKHDLHDRGMRNQRVTNKSFMAWRLRNPTLLTTDESAKQYLQMVKAEYVLTEGRQLINFFDKKYPDQFSRYDFYNLAKVNGFKFSMKEMNQEDLNKLAEIIELHKDRARYDP